ncbi:MAG: exo-beta-N-acetylmuramidase NamZ domain-containing protein, partial [Bacteroidota bacterium]
MKKFFVLFWFLGSFGISAQERVVVGAERLEVLLPLLAGKQAGLVVNHTSLSGESHLCDTLNSLGVCVARIFAPEHGFRGKADAGEEIRDGADLRTGAPVISLYGKRRKPVPDDFDGLDVVIFDIQDVGARFYTYISTLFYVMEACAENGKPLIVLDRPNPNGHYVDGPVLDTRFASFVG